MIKTQSLLALPAVKNIQEIVDGLESPITLTKGKFKCLEFRFKNNKASILHNGEDVKTFSNVWLSSYWKTRDLAYAVRLYLEHFKTPHTHVEEVTSKITDQMKFTLSGIDCPATLFIDTQCVSKHVSSIEEVCGYPLIIKDTTGSGGKHSVLVGNRAELETELLALPRTRKYFFQEYIANEYDWGVLVSNGKVVSAERSYPVDGEFRNNYNGATEEFVEVRYVPKQVKDIAIKASKSLGLNWSRADIIIDKITDEPYLMEVNRLPGITSGSHEVSGAQVFLNSHLGLA